MLRFFFSRIETPVDEELEKKSYLTISQASGFLDEPYFILQASQGQFIDPKWNFLQIEYRKPCVWIPKGGFDWNPN